MFHSPTSNLEGQAASPSLGTRKFLKSSVPSPSVAKQAEVEEPRPSAKSDPAKVEPFIGGSGSSGENSRDSSGSATPIARDSGARMSSPDVVGSGGGAGSASGSPAWKGVNRTAQRTRMSGASPMLSHVRAGGSSPALSPASESPVMAPSSTNPSPRAVGVERQRSEERMLTGDGEESAPTTSALGQSAEESEGTPGSAPRGERRWSFLADDEEAKEDIAQCYVWGIIGRMVRTVPKPPKLDTLGDLNVKSVHGGADHFLLLTETGVVFSWGTGTHGALGLGDTMPRMHPVPVEALSNHNVVCLAAARNHSAAITDRGTLFHWGSMGVPGFDMSTVPKTRSELKGNIMEEVALGDAFVLALVRGGNIMGWGENASGQLGCGGTTAVYVSPITITLEEKVAHIFCGTDVAGAVSMRNSAFIWGASLSKGGKPNRTPQRIPCKFKVQTMAIGARHVVLLSQEGRVYVMGENNRFQLGLPNPEEFRAVPTLQPMTFSEDGEEGSGPVTHDRSSSGGSSSPSLPRPSMPPPSLPPDAKKSAATFRLKPFASVWRGSVKKPGGPATGGGVGGGGSAGSAESAEFIQVKHVAAGLTHTTVLTAGGKVYEWGQMSVMQDASKETRSHLKPSPVLVEALDGVSIDRLVCSANAILAVVGLKNERDLKFLSFNPPIVRAASLDRLVDWLIRESRGPTDTFDYHFFLTVNTFSSPEEVLEKLQSRLRVPDCPSQLETRVVGIVYKWMRKRPKDFLSDAARELVRQMVSTGSDLYGPINKQLDKLDPSGGPKTNRDSKREVDGAVSGNVAELFKTDPSTVAEQLTLIEEALMAELDPRELLQNAWSKSDKDTRAPNVIRIIANFNRISFFVTTTIVSGGSFEERNKRVQFWCDVLKHCFSLNNINTSVAISSAFQSVPFHRLLKRELVEIKAGGQRNLDQVAALMKGNKAGYRRKMESILSSGEPAVPYLAVHLSDLTFLEDGNPNYVEDLINMQKRHLIGKQIGPLEKLQSRPYTTFQPNLRLKTYLSSVEGYQETALDHLVEKIIAEEGNASGGAPGGAGGGSSSASFKGPSNKTEMVQMLESEAQTSGDSRSQVWKEWFLRFSERGQDFLQTWRSSRAWELMLANLMSAPPAKREMELFIDIMSKMMPSVAPYLPVAIAAMIDCAKADPSGELQDQVIGALSHYKLAVLDVKPASAEMVSDVRLVKHEDSVAGIKRDRRDLVKMQSVLTATAPNAEGVTQVSQLLIQRVPVIQKNIARSKAELQQLVQEEAVSSTKVIDSLTGLDQHILALRAKEEELKRALEEIQKQIADAEGTRKDQSKAAEHDINALAMRKRIADSEINEMGKIVECVKVASASWEKFCTSLHADFCRNAEEAVSFNQHWLENKIEQMHMFLEMHHENLTKCRDDVAMSGGRGILSLEAFKSAKQEAEEYVQEATQFLAAVPTAMLEVHADALDKIVVLRENVQKLCSESQSTTTTPATIRLAPDHPPTRLSSAHSDNVFILPSQRLSESSVASQSTSSFMLPSERLLSNNNNNNK